MPFDGKTRQGNLVPKQPLNKNYDRVSPILIGPQTFEKRPKLAVYVAQIIAGWAQVDLTLATVLARYARRNIEQSIDMYLSIEGFALQAKMLDAAAKTALTRDNYLLYKATMRFIKLNYDIRNELAHWGWGITDTIPDALIIFEPVSKKKLDALAFNLVGQNLATMHGKISELKKQVRSGRYFFIGRSDLKKCADDMFKTEIFADRLQQLSSSESDIEEGRSVLLTRPELKQFYEKMVADEASKASNP